MSSSLGTSEILPETPLHMTPESQTKVYYACYPACKPSTPVCVGRGCGHCSSCMEDKPSRNDKGTEDLDNSKLVQCTRISRGNWSFQLDYNPICRDMVCDKCYGCRTLSASGRVEMLMFMDDMSTELNTIDDDIASEPDDHYQDPDYEPILSDEEEPLTDEEEGEEEHLTDEEEHKVKYASPRAPERDANPRPRKKRKLNKE